MEGGVWETPSPSASELPSWGKRSGALVAAQPMQQSPSLLSTHGLSSAPRHCSWCDFRQCPLLLHLTPKLHFLLLVSGDAEGPAPTAETTGHPQLPPPSQEDETASSSEGITVSAALETASLYQQQDGAHTSLPSLHPRPVSLQHELGVPAWFLAYATPCTLAGQRVVAHICGLHSPMGMTGMSLLAHMHPSCMTLGGD